MLHVLFLIRCQKLKKKTILLEEFKLKNQNYYSPDRVISGMHVKTKFTNEK